MDNPDGKQIVKQYTDWLRGEFNTDSYNSGLCEITLPFLNRRGTYIQVFVKRTDSGLMISDYGETIGDLRFCGLDIDTSARREMLNRILRSFSVRLEGKDELRTLASEDNLPHRLNELAQCMLAVDRMIFSTSPAKVARLAEEDFQVVRNSEKKQLTATRS
ncbi:MAG: DUF1828 domain-containing protein [Dehalococcoidia bacterium]|nr:DUF1828 domain-containing protein [Dehalococcoidia bacterium]